MAVSYTAANEVQQQPTVVKNVYTETSVSRIVTGITCHKLTSVPLLRMSSVAYSDGLSKDSGNTATATNWGAIWTEELQECQTKLLPANKTSLTILYGEGTPISSSPS